MTLDQLQAEDNVIETRRAISAVNALALKRQRRTGLIDARLVEAARMLGLVLVSDEEAVRKAFLCPACRGSGIEGIEHDICTACKGSGVRK